MGETIRYRAILLFGMPGAGKGTQGAVLAQLPGVIHISSGDLFRRLAKHGQLSREVVSYTTRGLLVPDELTIRIWRRYVEILRLQEELDEAQNTLLLDGIPRNLAQAEQLADLLDVIQIFHLKVRDLDQARARLAARAIRENRLDDINEEVVRRRFKVYEEETVRTLGFYDPSLIYEVDASREPLFVHRDIIDRLCEIDAGGIGRPPRLDPA